MDQLIIKGEGGANVVVQYGKNSKNLAQVIRLRKLRSNDDKELPKAGIDELIWPELLEQAAPLLSLQSDLQYICKFLTPLIGSQYIPPQVKTQINNTFNILMSPARHAPLCLIFPFPHKLYLCTTEQELINLDKAEAQIYGASQGVLMPDVTLLPLPSPPPLPPSLPSQQQVQPSTICIEIKPKYGSITKCSTIHPNDVALKHSTSRYQLHQLLKKHQKTIDTVSTYDPLDLFSGETSKMEKALHGLLENPQNNLTLFINGTPLDLKNSSRCEDFQQNVDETSLLLEQAIATAAEMLFPLENHSNDTPNTNRKQYLVSLLRKILQQEPVLQNISTAQQACCVDIEGIYQLHNKMSREMNKEMHQHDACEDPIVATTVYDVDLAEKKEREQHQRALDKLLQMPLKEAIEAIRSYIIATTAKDCSIMITMRRAPEYELNKSELPRLQTENENGLVIVDVVGKEKEERREHRVEYRISVVDLDRKSTSKIPKHYELDQQILKAAKKAATMK
jgi:inositol-pentakisphosphate 2-kinase